MLPTMDGECAAFNNSLCRVLGFEKHNSPGAAAAAPWAMVSTPVNICFAFLLPINRPRWQCACTGFSAFLTPLPSPESSEDFSLEEEAEQL